VLDVDVVVVPPPPPVDPPVAMLPPVLLPPLAVEPPAMVTVPCAQAASIREAPIAASRRSEKGRDRFIMAVDPGHAVTVSASSHFRSW
jgi:hypothetical protein